METATAFRPSFGFICCRPSTSIGRLGISKSNGANFLPFSIKSRFSASGITQYESISHSKWGQGRMDFGRRKSIAVKASMSSDSSGSSAPIAPLKLESPIGQFLSKILISHPHLVLAAVEQQLDQLQIDHDAEKQKEVPASSTDLVLYRRIAEVKAKESRKALEEILYALVVKKFMDANVSLIPAKTLSSSDSSSRVDSWQGQDDNLEGLHSPEAYEMIQNHLALILGNRLGDSTSLAQISKLRVGQVYAASVMYGYFLKRVDQRFQLEKTIKILPNGLDNEEISIQHAFRGKAGRDGNSGDDFSSGSHLEVSSRSPDISPGDSGDGMGSSRLRNYVMSFDSDTIQRYATIRSNESVSIIEKHTEALFGRPNIGMSPEGTIDSSKDKLIKISFGCLRRLVLEAVTFGSFLWDVESYVDSRYHFVTN